VPGTVLALGVAGGLAASPALAQTGSATNAGFPKLCPVLEALVSDEVSGPAPGNGEVIRFSSSLSQGTLTNNGSPAGAPYLDSPEDMAFDLNADIVTADMGTSTGTSQVIRVNRSTGSRAVVSGPGVGSGPALNGPYSIAVEPTGNILVLDYDSAYNERLLRIAPTGVRSVLTSASVGGGAALGNPSRVRVLNGVIYLAGRNGTTDQVLSVDAVTGSRALISGATRGTGPAFDVPTSMTSDSTTNSIVVLDQFYGGAGALIRVDLATGNRTVLSSNTAPTGVPNFNNPYDVVHDACTNSFYVLHSGSSGVRGTVLRVDDTTGARSLFASYTTASIPSNYSLLMRPYIVLPGGSGSGPWHPGGSL